LELQVEARTKELPTDSEAIAVETNGLIVSYKYGVPYKDFISMSYL
jgi:hypothetical protein